MSNEYSLPANLAGSNANPLNPTFKGFINTTYDALLAFEACLEGHRPHVPRRPHDRERSDLIKSGNVFIYEENASGIKRWTDGISWSPSRIQGNFLIYRELDEPFPAGEKKRALRKNKVSASAMGSNNKPEVNTRTTLNLPPTGVRIPPEEEAMARRTLVGSLVDSYHFKRDGLIKKTISISCAGVPHHLVSYYSVDDVVANVLETPTTSELGRMFVPRAELMHQQNFRALQDEFGQPEGTPYLGSHYANSYALQSHQPLQIPQHMPQSMPHNMHHNLQYSHHAMSPAQHISHHQQATGYHQQPLLHNQSQHSNQHIIRASLPMNSSHAMQSMRPQHELQGHQGLHPNGTHGVQGVHSIAAVHSPLGSHDLQSNNGTSPYGMNGNAPLAPSAWAYNNPIAALGGGASAEPPRPIMLPTQESYFTQSSNQTDPGTVEEVKAEQPWLEEDTSSNGWPQMELPASELQTPPQDQQQQEELHAQHNHLRQRIGSVHQIPPIQRHQGQPGNDQAEWAEAGHQAEWPAYPGLSM